MAGLLSQGDVNPNGRVYPERNRKSLESVRSVLQRETVMGELDPEELQINLDRVTLL